MVTTHSNCNIEAAINYSVSLNKYGETKYDSALLYICSNFNFICGIYFVLSYDSCLVDLEIITKVILQILIFKDRVVNSPIAGMLLHF